MIQVCLRLVKQTITFNGEDNSKKPFEFPFCSFSFAPIFSSSRDVGTECKPNSHSSCIHEPCIIGNKDPEIITAPQVLVCAITWHMEISAKRCGNKATNPQWDDHSAAQTGAGLKYSQFNATSCSAAKASQYNSVSTS